MSELKISNVLVVGAGAWGGAIAQLIAGNLFTQNNDSALLLYGNKEFDIKSKHPKLGIKLDDRIQYTCDFECVADFIGAVDCIFFVIPSNVLLEVAEQIKREFDKLDSKLGASHGKKVIPFVICSKGLDGANNCLYSASMEAIFNSDESAAFDYQIGVLSGPNFAKQVALGLPAITNIAFNAIQTARYIAALCENETFSVRCIDDVNGAQILGAYKNVMALAMGMLEGAGYSSNAIAKYLCNCFIEINQLLKVFDGKKDTALEPCGIGDIYLTCTNKESRNTSFGLKVGGYKSFGEYCDSTFVASEKNSAANVTVEGVNAVQSLKQISSTHQRSICSVDVLYKILFEGQEMLALQNLL